MANRLCIIALFALLVICPVYSSGLASENYCEDAEVWAEWDDMALKHPGDMNIQTLHALRIGICAKVSRGDLTLVEGTQIFESARTNILKKMKDELPAEEEHI